jgi:hypothetical protein
MDVERAERSLRQFVEALRPMLQGWVAADRKADG